MAHCIDHNGIKHQSARAMCEYYGVDYDQYRNRKKCYNLTIEEALTGNYKEKRDTTIFDHKGNKYNSIVDMCEAYNINTSTFNYHRRQGKSLEECLTFRNDTSITDHEGNVWPTKKAMCEAYGITVKTYDSRIRDGWSLDKCLTTSRIYSNKKVIAPNGIEYESITKMCEAYNVNTSAYCKRRSEGKSMEEALIPIRIKTATDPFGQIFESTKSMLAYYNIDNSTFYGRFYKHRYSLAESLGIIPMLNVYTRNTDMVKITDNLIIVNSIDGSPKKKPKYFLCVLNDYEVVLDRNTIIELGLDYYRKNVLPFKKSA